MTGCCTMADSGKWLRKILASCCCRCCWRLRCCSSSPADGRSSSDHNGNIVAWNPGDASRAIDDTDSAPSGVVRIHSIDYCLDSNGQEHHTDKYDAMHRSNGVDSNLVVRRGQKFRLVLTLSRPFDVTIDAMSFVFTMTDDDKPNAGHGTLIGISLKRDTYDMGTSYEWCCGIESKHGTILEILVKTAANAAIGEWRCEIDTHLNGRSGAATYKSPATFYLLFNPWCSADLVYLRDRREREEYVLTDSTLIWRGSYNRMKPSAWQLGQFERNVLECSILLLSTVGKVLPAFRGDPVRIARALSAIVNSPDDDGVVEGNWSENFSGGTAPTKWIGSVEILQEYYKRRRPVKFGQCWVFAGTLTAIARALGIPSRIITTYSCAHDTQASLTVDYFVDENGKVLEEMNSDSIWNYHVWNEVWMERADLSGVGNYNGWQVVDSTPQEMSDGVYRCGPAPVRAVKLGEILRPYDCHFVYAEVNADKLFWLYTGPSQPLKLLRKDTLAIGQLISTKAVGAWEREDITSTYKFAEKSHDERDTMLKALKQADSSFSRYYLNEDFNDIFFDFELLDDILIGESFFVTLQVKNRSRDSSYRISGKLRVETIHYTGRNREDIKSYDFDEVLSPESVQQIDMEVTFNEYYRKLQDQAAFNISCMAKLHETEYDYYAQDDFRVRKPDIRISIQSPPQVDRETDVILRLANTLPVPLKKCVFQVQGTGIEKQLEFKIAEVPVDGTASATFKYTPPYAGPATLTAKFSSKELNDVDGFSAFEIEPRDEDRYYNGYNRRPNEYIVRTNVIP